MGEDIKKRFDPTIVFIIMLIVIAGGAWPTYSYISKKLEYETEAYELLYNARYHTNEFSFVYLEDLINKYPDSKYIEEANALYAERKNIDAKSQPIWDQAQKHSENGEMELALSKYEELHRKYPKSTGAFSAAINIPLSLIHI